MAQDISLVGGVDQNGDNQFYVKKIVNGIPNQYPITVGNAGLDGYAHIVCGVIFQWGIFTISSSPQAVTFSEAFPSSCYNVQLTVVDNSDTPAVIVKVLSGSVTTTGFTALCVHTPTQVYYFATGY